MVSRQTINAPQQSALAWLAGVCLLSACPQAAEAPASGTGGLGLQLKVGSEVSVREITYQLRQKDGAFARSGSFGVEASGDMATAFVGSLTPADGYQMQLDAQAVLQSSGASTHCSGLASFGIVKGETTVVAVRMRCDGVRSSPASPGNQCPSIGSLRALPAEAPLGRSVEVVADATDPDGKAVVLTYMWSASVGRIVAPFAASTSYQCNQPGIVDLTLAVSDGDPLCTEQATLYVSCRAPDEATGAAGNPISSAALGSAGRKALATAGVLATSGTGALVAGNTAALSSAGATATTGGAGRVATGGAAAGRVSSIWPPPEPPQGNPQAPAGTGTVPTNVGGAGAAAPPPPASGGRGASDAGMPVMDPQQEPDRRREGQAGERPRRRDGEAGARAPEGGAGGVVSTPQQPQTPPAEPPPADDPPPAPMTGGSGGMAGSEVPPVDPAPVGGQPAQAPPVAGAAPTPSEAPPTSGAAGGGEPTPPPEPPSDPIPSPDAGVPDSSAGSDAPPTAGQAGEQGPAAGSGGQPSARWVRPSSQHAV